MYHVAKFSSTRGFSFVVVILLRSELPSMLFGGKLIGWLKQVILNTKLPTATYFWFSEIQKTNSTERKVATVLEFVQLNTGHFGCVASGLCQFHFTHSPNH